MAKKNSNSRYLFVLPTDSIGGAERVVKNIVLEIINNSCNVDLIFLCKGDNGHWHDLSSCEFTNLIYLDSKSEIRSLHKFFYFFIFKRVCYDFIFTTHTHINALVSLLRIVKIIKSNCHVVRESTVIFDRFFGLKRLGMQFLYFFYRDLSLIVFQTHYMKKRLLEENPRLKRYDFKVLRNPINLNFINQNLSLSTCKHDDVFEIVFVGRLVPIKNVELILYSLDILKTNSIDFRFKIVGSGAEDDNLNKIVKKLNLESNVTFTGAVCNPYIHMCNADLGVISSFKEGFPNVIIEMMASGTKNIVSTPCAGDLEMLPNILVLKSFSIDEMSSTLMELIKNRVDNSSIYREYAKSINVDSYLHQLNIGIK